ncbi:14165_t:CDS:1, partial [Acaulospora colombiana]
TNILIYEAINNPTNTMDIFDEEQLIKLKLQASCILKDPKQKQQTLQVALHRLLSDSEEEYEGNEESGSGMIYIEAKIWCR